VSLQGGDNRSGLSAVEPGLFFVLGITVLAYLNAFAGAFQFDDYNVILGSAKAHSFSAWFGDLPHGIRPLLTLSYLLNQLSGGGAAGFHLVNLLIHLVNVGLVYRLARSLALSCQVEPGRGATLASAIFALHPLQTEAVTYLSGRSSSLAALFYLTALLLHEKARQKGVNSRLYRLTPLCFLAALLAKETAVTLPLALLLWDMAKRGPGRVRDHFRAEWRSWLLLPVLLVALLLHPRYGALLEYSFDIRSRGENLLSQGNAVCYLLSRLLILTGMNIDPDLRPVTRVDGALALRIAFLAVLAATGLATLRRHPWLGFGILWFLLHLVPTNSLVPRLDLVNDRQAYLPMAGVALTVGLALGFLADSWNRRCLRAAAAGLFMVLALSTFLRNRDYRSEIALWEDTVGKSPDKARPHNNLGYAYLVAGRHREARVEFLTALRIDPEYPLAAANLKATETALAGKALEILRGVTPFPLAGPGAATGMSR